MVYIAHNRFDGCDLLQRSVRLRKTNTATPVDDGRNHHHPILAPSGTYGGGPLRLACSLQLSPCLGWPFRTASIAAPARHFRNLIAKSGLEPNVPRSLPESLRLAHPLVVSRWRRTPYRYGIVTGFENDQFLPERGRGGLRVAVRAPQPHSSDKDLGCPPPRGFREDQ